MKTINTQIEPKEKYTLTPIDAITVIGGVVATIGAAMVVYTHLFTNVVLPL